MGEAELPPPPAIPGAMADQFLAYGREVHRRLFHDIARAVLAAAHGVKPLSDERIVSHRDPNCPVCGQHSFPMTPAALAVLSERQRQVLKEGWTFMHDDADHDDGMLAAAGAAYTLAAADKLCPYSQGDGGFDDKPPSSWPGDWQWKPSDPRRMLVKAGALILAEIERLDRATEAHGIKP